MKKKIFFLLLLLLLLLFGCTKKEDTGGAYTIYYRNTAGTGLYAVSYTPQAQTFEELMEELLGQLASASADADYESPLPAGVELQGYERGIDALRIDFSSSYYDMSNTDEVLLRAAVVKTIVQIPGVTKIILTVDSVQLVDANGDTVTAMDADTFIDTNMQLVSEESSRESSTLAGAD